MGALRPLFKVIILSFLSVKSLITLATVPVAILNSLAIYDNFEIVLPVSSLPNLEMTIASFLERPSSLYARVAFFDLIFLFLPICRVAPPY